MRIIINPSYKFLEDFIYSLPANFEKSGKVIYEGRNILRQYTIKNVDLVVKRFKQPHLINRIVYRFFRLSKANRSYHYGLELFRRGIATPEPIAFIEKRNFGLTDSYYISLNSPLKHTMREFWFDPEIGERKFILEAFGKFTARLHQKGVLHLDYSSGNILFDIENGNPVFSLVDINRIRFGKVTEEEGYKSFARLWLPNEVYVIIAKCYAAESGYNETHAIERICYYKDCFMKQKK